MLGRFDLTSPAGDIVEGEEISRDCISGRLKVKWMLW